MKKYRVAVIEGDGIGPEITDEAVKVLSAVAKKFSFEISYERALMGGAAIDKTGVPLPEQTLEICRGAQAVLLGAVGGPKWDSLPGSKRPEAGLLEIRKALGLYANLRPVTVFPSLRSASPLKEEIIKDGLDIMIVRELTGGIYFGERGTREKDGILSAYDTERYSVPEIERIGRTAFMLADRRGKRLCSVDKANVLSTSRLWRGVMEGINAEFPEVELTHMYVDNCAMQLVKNPAQFDVLVTSNMFGDILSDEASMISGSIGMLASASINETGFGLYEPIHGSAPDIAGTGKANPLAQILSAAMMLRVSLGELEAARDIERAVDLALERVRTQDIYSAGENIRQVTCEEMGQEVAALLS